MEAGKNPVQKIPLMVTGDDAEVFTELLFDNDGGGEGGEFNDNKLTEETGTGRETMDRRSNRMETQELHYMNSLFMHTCEVKNAIRDEMDRYHKQKKRMRKMMNKHLNSLIRYPKLIHGIRVSAQRCEGGEGSDESKMNKRGNDYSENSLFFQDDENLLTLIRNPNSIHKSWDKYKFGIGDKKAAKTFTSKERWGGVVNTPIIGGRLHGTQLQR